MSEILVNTIKKADGTGGLTVPTTAGNIVTTGGATFTGAVTGTDITLSGGVVFGDAGGSGTSTSNTLDSYEEGTWTPTLGGTATYLIQSGYYTKVGRMVHFSFELHVNAIGSGSNNRVGGLPFAGNSNRESQGSRGYFASLAKSVTSLLPYVPKGDTGIYFTDTTTAQSTVNLNSVIFQNNARIQASGIYFTP